MTPAREHKHCDELLRDHFHSPPGSILHGLQPPGRQANLLTLLVMDVPDFSFASPSLARLAPLMACVCASWQSASVGNSASPTGINSLAFQ
jgi:hypothetical protein